jgi:hypothetical protein
LLYVFVDGLILVAHLVHGRRPHHPAELLAAAVDQAVAGVVGGFTPRRRVQVYAQLRRAAGAPGVDQVRALVRVVPTDPVELFGPLRLVNRRLVNRRRRAHRLRRRLRVGRTVGILPFVTAAVLVGQVIYAFVQFGSELLDRLTHGTVRYAATAASPGWLPLVLGLGSTLVCTVLVTLGLRHIRRNTAAAYRWFYRALLVNLLFTRVFQFAIEQFLATVSVLVDVVLLGLITMALSVPMPAVPMTPTPGVGPRRDKAGQA